MATLTQLRDKANTVLTKFWQWLVTAQDAYYAKHGKYFQLIVSPDNTVVDAEDSTFVKKFNPNEANSIS